MTIARLLDAPRTELRLAMSLMAKQRDAEFLQTLKTRVPVAIEMRLATQVAEADRFKVVRGN
jgi:hypothetical protein